MPIPDGGAFFLMLVIQKHTGRVLGRCDIHEPFGRGFLRAYMTETALTCIKFRYGLTPKGVKPFIIAHGYRDASMLPGFQRAIDNYPWEGIKNAESNQPRKDES
jgi:hypothetical protein